MRRPSTNTILAASVITFLAYEFYVQHARGADLWECFGAGRYQAMSEGRVCPTHRKERPMAFKRGGYAYVKNVGFGTSFERFRITKVTKKGVYLDALDSPFDPVTGRYLSDLPSAGITVSLCVSAADIARAKKEALD